MLTDTILGWLGSALAALINALPHPALPDWVTVGIPSWFVSGLLWAVQMGHWIPVQAIGFGAAFLLFASGLAFAIRLARIGLSFATFGGGSAA